MGRRLNRIAPEVRAAGGVVDVHLIRGRSGTSRSRGSRRRQRHRALRACPNLRDVVALGREHGLQVGMAFNPETDVDEAAQAAREAEVDIILCMTSIRAARAAFIMESSTGSHSCARCCLAGCACRSTADSGDNIRALFDAERPCSLPRPDLRPRTFRARPAAWSRRWREPGAGARARGAGRGSVEPTHPLVGAVLVREARSSARAGLRVAASPHAEVAALAAAGEHARGGRCTCRSTVLASRDDAAVRGCGRGGRVARVVAAVGDSNPRSTARASSGSLGRRRGRGRGFWRGEAGERGLAPRGSPAGGPS